ncbi:MAG: CBS domain-containing protein [Acidobacteria bacterium]|nr:CBS domain-containing protein [Acidobacteriota bacterium]
MLVRDFMTTEVTSLQETDNLLEARMVFLRSSFRHLPVLRDKQLVGVVTEHDVKQFAPSLTSGMSPEEYNQLLESTPVSRAMTRDPVTLLPGQSIYDAAFSLYSKRFGCLPVVENGEMVGIITTTDMLGLLVRLIRDQGLVPGEPRAES